MSAKWQTLAMQEELANVSWVIVGVLTVLGVVLLSIGLKGFNSKKMDQRDSLGVAWSERFGILTMNGIFLLSGALILSIVKIAKP
jgi:hypothetical protein